MKIGKFLQQQIKKLPDEVTKISFDIGLDADLEVDDESPNRIKINLKSVEKQIEGGQNKNDN